MTAGRSAADEPVEVVDLEGRVTGVVPRHEMRRRRLRHRCTFVVVQDSAGQVLVHRRAPTKDLWPDRWDLAAGGVAAVGEEWEAAARRELAEELGVEGVVLEPLGEGLYQDGEVAEVARMWRVTWDGEVRFADGEVVEARWVAPAELAAWIGRAPWEFVPDSVTLLADRWTQQR